LRDFYDAWMQVSDREIALLPATLGPAPARAAQDRVLAGMTTAAALVLCGWMLALVCLAQIFVIAVTRPFGPPPWRWRWSGWAPAAAGAMIALPVLVLVPAVAWGTMPFIWLFSGRSIGAMVLLSTSVPLAWMTATRIFVVPPEAMRAGMLSRRAVLAGLALLLLVGFLVAVLVPMDGAVWRPPAGVQVLRRIGGSVGLAAIAILVVWTILGVRSRRRAGVRAGMWARAGLAVASAGLVPLLAAAAVALAANAYRDARHAEAFSRAVADPVSDRLGPDWYGRYFEPARRLAG
jgi:hypothetical protein